MYDFDFLRDDILKPFFAEPRIIDVLKTLKNYDWAGWEKWLQIEMLHFLTKHEKISAFSKELKFKKKAKQEKNIFVDLGFKIKGTHGEELILVEIKRKKSLKPCLNESLKDAEKIKTIPKSSFNELDKDINYSPRSAWVLGFFHSSEITEKDILNIIETDSKYNIFNKKTIYCRLIEDTGFGLYLIKIDY